MLTERNPILNDQISPAAGKTTFHNEKEADSFGSSASDERVSPAFPEVKRAIPVHQNGITRNPRLFYEATFIAKPKLLTAPLKQPSDLTFKQRSPIIPEVCLCRISDQDPGYNSANGFSSASQSPASSLTRSSNGTRTPDSLKGNLRKEGFSGSGQKKRVQFDLKNDLADGGDDSIILESDFEEESYADEIDDIERSLMQGFNEFDQQLQRQQTTGQSNRKRDLTLNLGLFSQNGEITDAARDLDQQTWYFGAITRQEAEFILRECDSGSWIVRSCDSCKGNYSIAIKGVSGFVHLKIHRQSDDMYRLADFNRAFLSVPDLVEYYSAERLPIKGNECIRLLHPVHQQLL